MALVTANGVTVIGGTINYPLTGTWTADLILDQTDGSGFSAGTKVEVDVDGSRLVVGTVVPDRTGDFLDAVHVRLLGGAGGLNATTATSRSFVQPGAFVSDVVNALVADAGETLSITADAGFLNTNLSAWAITPRPVGQCLQVLVDIVNQHTGLAYNWRVLADGTLWIGQDSWSSASGTFEIISQNPADASWNLGVDAPFVMPGTTLPTVGQVGRVEHRIESNKIRQKVWQYIANDERGLVGSVRKMVRQQTAGVDYLAFYEATVVTQSADGSTLDAMPIDRRIAGLQRISLRLGLPGCVAKFAPGTTVMLGFKSGDPSQPYLHSFKGGETVTALQLAGTHPAPLWDNYLNALTTWVTAMQTMINALVTPTGIAPAAQSAAATACGTMLGLISGGTLSSAIVSNG